MVTLSLCVDLISLKIACDFVMNSAHYSKNTSSEILTGISEVRDKSGAVFATRHLILDFLPKMPSTHWGTTPHEEKPR